MAICSGTTSIPRAALTRTLPMPPLAPCHSHKLATPMPTIFLDCDGVLADLEKGAGQVLGMPPNHFERRFGLGKFWAKLASTPDFFNTLELLPDATDLFEAVRRPGPLGTATRQLWLAWGYGSSRPSIHIADEMERCSSASPLRRRSTLSPLRG